MVRLTEDIKNFENGMSGIRTISVERVTVGIP